jgi:GNAT superfamily N-acetyltransferase
MLTFTSFARHEPGIIFSLLSQSYAAYLEHDPLAAEKWPASWQAYDRDVFFFPDTIGTCGFITCLEDRAIGFASWDPRGFPEVGIIGHNCILPAFQGNGYGKTQIRRVLASLKARGFQRARVTTGEHTFFAPAQRIYQACGFREIQRGCGDPHLAFRTIDYECILSDLVNST